MKQTLTFLANQSQALLAAHWLALFNFFFVMYIALPLLAPILLAVGYSSIALTIYRIFGYTCHQLPSHSYFIFGYQVAICQRCAAIHGAMALAGLLYALLRQRHLSPLGFSWYLLFIIPVAVDGGMAWVSLLLTVIPAYIFWAIGLTMIALLGLILYSQKLLVWQVWLFFLAGPLSLLYAQGFGPYESDWLRRTLTGIIYAIGTMWLVYPTLEESFAEVYQHAQMRLVQAQTDGLFRRNRTR